jgi:hypothetical protein
VQASFRLEAAARSAAAQLRAPPRRTSDRLPPNFDLNFEWYLQPGTLLSVAFFKKKLGSYPRQQAFVAKLDEFLSPELYETLRTGLVLTPTQAACMDGENIWTVTSFVDSPGGVINGVEGQYQQVYLPARAVEGFRRHRQPDPYRVRA